MEVMAAPGAPGVQGQPPPFQFQPPAEFNPQYYPPPGAGPPPVAPFLPNVAPPLSHQNNKKHNRHHHNNRERVRTLFISGLPEDIKHREIYNLFRRRVGFETCQLKYTGRGYQGEIQVIHVSSSVESVHICAPTESRVK
eukprot:Gb_19628 [translate_table: standard]